MGRPSTPHGGRHPCGHFGPPGVEHGDLQFPDPASPVHPGQLEGLGPKDVDRIGIILPSADLAPTVMTALPPEIQKVNLTMGVPLDRTPLRSLLSIAFGLQNDRGRLHHSRVKPSSPTRSPGFFTPVPRASKPFTRHCAARNPAATEALGPLRVPGVDAALAPWWRGQDARKGTTVATAPAMLTALAEWTSRPSRT